MSRPAPPRANTLLRHSGIALVTVICLTLTVVAWRIVAGLERESAEERFNAIVSGIVLRIESRLADYEQSLSGAAAFMRASDPVSRLQWRTYAETMRFNERYPGIQGLGFARKLAPRELAAHTDAVRREGFADYRVWPSGEREEYTAILYLEPINPRTRGALGYDMFADPLRREAMVRARDSGRAALSRRVTLLRDTDPVPQPGLLMYLPYYGSGPAAATPEERRNALAGYIYAPIRVREFIESALRNQLGSLALEIFDGDSTTADNLLFEGGGSADARAAFRQTRAIEVLGRTWTLRTASLPDFEQSGGGNTPLAVLLAGLLVTGLATLTALASSISRERTAALAEARRETQRILENLDDAFFALDKDWRLTYLNPKGEQLLRRKAGDLLGKNFWLEFPGMAGTEFQRRCEQARATGDSGNFIVHHPPLQAWLEVHAYPHAGGISVFLRNINRRRQREEALRLRERALEASANAILITDQLQPDQPIIYANPALERICGYTAAEAMGRNCRFLQGNDRGQPELERLRDLIGSGEEGRVVLRNYRKNGELFWNDLYVAPVKDEGGRVTHYVGVLSDITESKQYQIELERRATHDLLTGLANRGLLMDRIQLAVMQAKRRSRKIALLFIDLDGFKIINDGFGHAVGDQVLKLTGNRLAANIRQGDTAARLGGDEFVVVLNDQERIEEISDAVQRIMEAVLRPIPIQRQDIALTCSIGISVCPDDGEDPDELLKFADIAMYKAKEEGKNTSRFYTRGMNDTVIRKVTLTNNLRRALERSEFLLHYQPQIDLRNGALRGAEALIRWQHPQFGLLSPAQFIPLAEQSSQIVHIGQWVLRTACAQAAAFARSGLPDLVMSVNLSARQLRDEQLVSMIREILRETGLPPGCLELEITESLVMSDVEKSVAILAGIKDAGVRIAMDDFGTGYSSLSYLKRFPVDRLKIDQSFIRDVTSDASDAALTRAIIAMAHNLGMEVVAEGVETAAQRDFLVAAGCDLAQGYFYGRPVEAGAFAAQPPEPAPPA